MAVKPPNYFIYNQVLVKVPKDYTPEEFGKIQPQVEGIVHNALEVAEKDLQLIDSKLKVVIRG